MKINAQVSAAHERESDRLDGVGAFIWQERERIRAAASRQNVTGEGGSTVECRLRGASMAGAIPPGSRIRIAFDRGPHGTGDIVAFMLGERIVVHRVVYRGPGHLITRGDAMLLPDPPIDAVAVLGKVIAMDSGSGWRQPGAQTLPPRRDRLLALATLTVSGLLLRIDVDIARRFIEWLDAADHRFAWTRKLLY